MSEIINELTRMKGYSYQIWDYQLSHSVLTLRATHKQKKSHNIHITFTSVGYFQFPLSWEGDLFPAPENELLEILVKIGSGRLDEVLPMEYLEERFSLYKANSPNSTIFILGHLAKIEYDIEPIYN